MRVVTIKMDESLLSLLDLYAANKRLSRSEIMREALIMYLRENTKPLAGFGPATSGSLEGLTRPAL